MDFTDSAPLSKVRLTPEGYLVTDAYVARAGIQLYAGADVGLVDQPYVSVYRPEDEVFKASSLTSFAHRPITLSHPKDGVSSKNWKDVAVGQTGEEVLRDGQFVRVPMVVMDKKTIDAIQAGTRELSMGYSCEIELVDGVAPDGQAYQAIQKNLRMNHLAIVAKARGGSRLRIGDDDEKETDMADNAIKTQTVLVDGLQVETTDAGAAAILKLQKQLSDAATSTAVLVADHAKVLATRDATIDDLKSKVLTDAQLIEHVKKRSSLIALAGKLAPKLVADSMTDDEIRSAVVRAKCGDAAVTGKTADYVAARFDILVEDAAKDKGKDPVGRALSDGSQTLGDGDYSLADKAYEEHVAQMSNAWAGKGSN